MNYSKYKELINETLNLLQVSTSEQDIKAYLQNEDGAFADAETAHDILVRARLRYLDKTLTKSIIHGMVKP